MRAVRKKNNLLQILWPSVIPFDQSIYHSISNVFHLISDHFFYIIQCGFFLSHTYIFFNFSNHYQLWLETWLQIHLIPWFFFAFTSPINMNTSVKEVRTWYQNIIIVWLKIYICGQKIPKISNFKQYYYNEQAENIYLVIRHTEA